jgi:hypothetical protein
MPSTRTAKSGVPSSRKFLPPVMMSVKRKVEQRIFMEVDNDKIDEAVLALLYLTLHDGARAWKSFDWDAMNRLHEKGYIMNPVGKAKSVPSFD